MTPRKFEVGQMVIVNKSKYKVLKIKEFAENRRSIIFQREDGRLFGREIKQDKQGNEFAYYNENYSCNRSFKARFLP